MGLEQIEYKLCTKMAVQEGEGRQVGLLRFAGFGFQLFLLVKTQDYIHEANWLFLVLS